jgi:hypothetical protein
MVSAVIRRTLPSIKVPTQHVMNATLESKRVEPKPFDPLLDTVKEVKDLSGKVVFVGTLRQWRVQAKAKEDALRAQYGLPPKSAVRRKPDHT